MTNHCPTCGCCNITIDASATVQQEGNIVNVPDEAIVELKYVTTDPKYNILATRSGCKIVNASTNKEVAEPIFIVRAKDAHAINVLGHYAAMCKNEKHADAVLDRMGEFVQWRLSNVHLLKEPDTDGTL